MNQSRTLIHTPFPDVVIFIRLPPIIDLYSPSPDAPSTVSAMLEIRSATLAYRTPSARMSKQTLIYLLLSVSILLVAFLWAVEAFIFEIFSLRLSRFPPSEYIFPFFFYSRSVLTVYGYVLIYDSPVFEQWVTVRRTRLTCKRFSPLCSRLSPKHHRLRTTLVPPPPSRWFILPYFSPLTILPKLARLRRFRKLQAGIRKNAATC